MIMISANWIHLFCPCLLLAHPFNIILSSTKLPSYHFSNMGFLFFIIKTSKIKDNTRFIVEKYTTLLESLVTLLTSVQKCHPFSLHKRKLMLMSQRITKCDSFSIGQWRFIFRWQKNSMFGIMFNHLPRLYWFLK